MARVAGALNKKGSDGVKMVVGVGVTKPTVNTKVVTKKPKAQSGKSSTQGKKPTKSIYPKMPMS